MAVGTPTSLAANGSATDAASYDTATYTPTAGAKLVAVIGVGHRTVPPSAPTSLTGHGVTWTKRPSGEVMTSNNIWNYSVWEATAPASPGSDDLTIALASTAEACLWQVFEATGAQIIQHEFLPTSAANPSLTLDNAISAGGVTLGLLLNSNATTTITAGSGYTDLGAQTSSATAPVWKRAGEYKMAGTTTVDFTASGTVVRALLGVELGPSLAQVTATRATTWNTKAAATGARATTWDALSATSATRATTWRVRALVTGTRATSWRVRATVTGSRATTWDTLAAVTGSRATSWDVLAFVSGTRATTWDVLAGVTSSRATSWDVLTSATATRATTWRVLARVTGLRATSWNVASSLLSVTSSRATTWRVRALVTGIRATTWRVLARTTGSRATTWDVLSGVTGTRATSWRVRAPVTTSRGTTWRALQATTAARGTTWRTLERVTAVRSSTWNVEGTAQPTVPVGARSTGRLVEAGHGHLTTPAAHGRLLGPDAARFLTATLEGELV